MNIKISYAITACNELHELKKLLDVLLSNITSNSEIQILLDEYNSTQEIKNFLIAAKELHSCIYVHEYQLNNDFAAFKNYLNSKCNGEFIFQIDADEYPHQEFIKILPNILDANPNIDLYKIARINIVDGITKEYIQSMGWNINYKNWINFPDSQSRIYRNNNQIKWVGKVHEIITGHTSYSNLPEREEYCLYHIKTFEKQKKQNKLYELIMKNKI